MKNFCSVGLMALLLSFGAAAQFSGPSAKGEAQTVAQAREESVGTYVSITGRVINRVREDYYTFADASGEIRVEIEPEAWRGREIGPDDQIRINAEVDRNIAGTKYLWVESFQVVEGAN